MSTYKEEKLAQYDKQFGVCTLSLCDEHEQMRCHICKCRDFISELIDECEKQKEEAFDKGFQKGWLKDYEKWETKIEAEREQAIKETKEKIVKLLPKEREDTSIDFSPYGANSANGWNAYRNEVLNIIKISNQ